MNLQPSYKIRKRRIDTQPYQDKEESQEYLYPSYDLMNKRSLISIQTSPKNKLKLIPIKQASFKGKDNSEARSKSKINTRRAKSYLSSDIQSMKGEISKIRHQIMSKKSKIHTPNFLSQQIVKTDDQYLYSPVTQTKKQLFKPVWNEKNNNMNPKKHNSRVGTNQPFNKIYNDLNTVSESQSETQQYEQSSHYFPIIDKSRLKESYYRNRRKDRYSSESYDNSTQRLKQYFQSMRNQSNARSRLNLQNFRKVAHAVLFTIYLRKFNQRMRQRRKSSFVQFISTRLKPKLLQILELIIQHSKPFFNMLSQQCNFDFRPHPKDDSKLRKQKVKYLKKMLSLQIQCLKEAVGTIAVQSQNYSQLLYFLCRHGSYGNLHSIYTPQELNLMCVSQFYSYLRAEKYLQMSALISLVMIKLLLFNVLLDQHLIVDLFGNKNMGFMSKTTLLIGNILYQLFIDIQDEFLERVPPIYKVGNWQELKNKIKFKFGENMTVKEGFFQKSQLISGLQDHKTIIELFGTKQMLSQKQEIQQTIKKLYVLICNYHKKVRAKSFIV